MRRIGIDFDNTIICYDDVFTRVARDRGWLADGGLTKTQVRDHVRTLPDGETKWQHLQADVYGPRIAEATLFDGVADFMRACRARGWPVFVVSHKTEYAPYGDGTVKLPDVARAWLEARGLIGDDGASAVYFEPTRDAKIARIKALGCTDFIDDLEEVFSDPAFPHDIRRILFAREEGAVASDRWITCASWQAIADCLLADPSVIARALTGDRAVVVESLAGGGNGRSFHVRLSSGDERFLKLYPSNPNDPRDRQGAEERALVFLAAAGFANVPRFVAADRGAPAALLDWIDGTAIQEAGSMDVAQALEFLTRLHAQRYHPAAAGIGPASESCPCPADAIVQIEARITRLLPEAALPLMALLTERIRPLAERLATAVRQKIAGFDVRLPDGALTLSPSDFGLHNALRRPDGTVIWLDFEYFGWDDPVKLVADTLLHPGMRLDPAHARVFREGAAAIYGADGDFLTRLRYMMPIYDLRWCMIILNAFDPAHHARHLGDEERARRLATVMARLDRIEAGYEAYGFLR